MSTYTNAAWLTQLAAQTALLSAGTITQVQFETNMLPYTDGWIGIASSDMVLAQKITDTVTSLVLRDESFDDWCAGTATGGPYGNGDYPLVTLSGGTIVVPSIQKMLTLVTHGTDAKTGFGFSCVGGYNANELLQLIGAPGPIIIDPSQVSGWAVNAPTSNSTFLVKKNGASWGSVTFVGGFSNNVTCSFSTNSVNNGDAIMLYAPGVVDATLRNFTITIPGV